MYSLFVTNNDKRRTGKFILVSVFLGFQFETLIPKKIFFKFQERTETDNRLI